MGLLDNLQAFGANRLSGIYSDAVISVPGALVNDGMGGYQPSMSAAVACKVQVSNWSRAYRLQNAIPATAARLLMIQAGAPKPEEGALITVRGTTYTVSQIVQDPCCIYWDMLGEPKNG